MQLFAVNFIALPGYSTLLYNFNVNIYFNLQCIQKRLIPNYANWLCFDFYKLFLTYVIPETTGMTHLKI
jgi:hypothetical protein